MAEQAVDVAASTAGAAADSPVAAETITLNRTETMPALVAPLYFLLCGCQVEGEDGVRRQCRRLLGTKEGEGYLVQTYLYPVRGATAIFCANKAAHLDQRQRPKLPYITKEGERKKSPYLLEVKAAIAD